MRSVALAIILASSPIQAAKLYPVDPPAPIPSPQPFSFNSDYSRASIIAILAVYKNDMAKVKEYFERLLNGHQVDVDLFKYGSHNMDEQDCINWTDKSVHPYDPLHFVYHTVKIPLDRIAKIEFYTDNQRRYYDGSTPIIVPGEWDGYWDFKRVSYPPFEASVDAIIAYQDYRINGELFSEVSTLIDRRDFMGSYTAKGCMPYMWVIYEYDPDKVAPKVFGSYMGTMIWDGEQ